MKLKIKLLKPFSDIIGTNLLELDFTKSTLNDLIKTIIEKYPNLRSQLINDFGEITEYVGIFINDKPISALQGLETKLKHDDTLVFFLPLSGG